MLDTGSPTIVLRLERNPAYAERGLPENVSPYKGTRLVLVGAKAAKDPPTRSDPEAKRAEAEGRGQEASEEERAPRLPLAPAGTAQARLPAFRAHRPSRPTRCRYPTAPGCSRSASPARREPTQSLVNYWLFQHSWLVTGAKFGWHDGAEALRILVRVDQSMQSRWGIGAKSAAVARAALAEVESKSSK